MLYVISASEWQAHDITLAGTGRKESVEVTLHARLSLNIVSESRRGVHTSVGGGCNVPSERVGCLESQKRISLMSGAGEGGVTFRGFQREGESRAEETGNT